MTFVEKIKLNNFRCYENKVLTFSKGINIIYGSNGVGKTSVVEGISYLLIGKSFRNVKDSEVLKDNQEYFSVVGEINSNKYVVYFDNNGKKISKNQNQYSRISDFVGENCLVSFSPEDLRIIDGGPSEKRKFMDVCLCQIDQEYLKNLSMYNKILKERNQLLKNYKDDDSNSALLEIINNKIIEYGKVIIKKREEFINKIKNNVEKYMDYLSNTKDTVEITYKPKVYINTYEKELSMCKEHDIFLETTTIGPHRDDILVNVNKKEAESCASQGQKRSFVLALKLSFYDLLIEMEKNSLVILDDVFSELDIERQNNLLNVLKNNSQVFITCTNIDQLSKEILKDSNIIDIRKE